VNFLRQLRTSRLLVLCASVLALGAGGATVATTAFSGGPKPPAKPLNAAVHDALAAPSVEGVTARIEFTNKLIDGSSLSPGSPLLKGASGRLWASSKTHSLRLELQSDRGDAQLVVNGQSAWLYDASANTVYRGQLPQHSATKETKRPETGKHEIPTLKEISDAIAHVDRNANLSGALPSSIAGQKAYTVRISPKHDGGLLGAGELAWDAAHGLPLRLAVYAQGSSSPVLELKATNINFGPVDASVFNIAPPKGAKVVELNQSKAGEARSKAHRARQDARSKPEVRGPQAVQAALPFRLTAPAKLAGIPRHDVRLLDWGGSPTALVTYGENLGGIAVIEQKLKPGEKASLGNGNRRSEDQLPKVSVNGATGTELATALGTVVRFERGGVAYTVLGSIPAQAAEAAARGL
jgi:outer membrane lipoprotein-sorting protein